MGKTQKRRGFTLVELLVVLLILGVLVGLAVPRYMDAQKNARFRTFTANVREIQSTLEVYRMDKTSTGPAEYPDNLSELTSYFTQPPINPYTGKSMLSDNPEESGLQYTNNGGTYTLTVVQRDVDDVNKNGDTTEPLPVALNVASETETPTVIDTEPPVILAATLTGTVDGEYGRYDITPIDGLPRTVTVNINDTVDMVLSITAKDNAGLSRVMIQVPYSGWEEHPMFDAPAGTWDYFIEDLIKFDNLLHTGNYTIWCKIIDVNGNTRSLVFNLVVTE